MFNWNKFDIGGCSFFHAIRQFEIESEYHLLSDLFLRAYKSKVIFYMPFFYILFVSFMCLKSILKK